MSGQPVKRQQRAVQAHQRTRRDATIEAHLREDCGPRRVAHGDHRCDPQAAQQIADRGRHRRETESRGRRRGREAVPGKVRRHDRERVCEKGRKITPGMSCRPRAVKEQHCGTAPECLHVPAQSCGVDKATGVAIRPIDYLGRQLRSRARGNDPGDPAASAAPARRYRHDNLAPEGPLADRTAVERTCASARGSGRYRAPSATASCPA